MTVLGIRFCTVLPEDDAKGLAGHLGPRGIGLAERDLSAEMGEGFFGAVFPAGNASWIETWKAGEGMPEGIMLHIVVDDADAYAQTARSNGIEMQGPMEAHGERIYFTKAPGGLSLAILSKASA